MATRTETFELAGMSCTHCVRAVEEALSEQPGVVDHEVKIGAALVRFDADATDRAALVQAVEDAGYAVQTVD